jgi:hypothetical protein
MDSSRNLKHKGENMIRSIKLLGLTVTALVASSVLASAAMAIPQFEASAYPATVTGSNSKGSEYITTEAGTHACNSHFEGSLSSASSTLTLTPKYSECESFGFLSATYSAEGCTYVLHATEQLATNLYAHHMDVACPEGKSIKVTSGSCKWEIKPQTGRKTIETTNVAGGTLTLEWNVTNLAINVTQDGFGCPFSGAGEKTASYHGHLVLSRVGGGSITVGGA